MNQNMDQRVSQLIDKMTLEEKLAQMTSYWSYELFDSGQISDEKMGRLLSNGIGQISRLAGASTLEPLGVARAANQIQRYLVEQTRLGIPAVIHEEVCNGYLGRDGTIFPQMLGLAATFNPSLAYNMAVQIRKQMRSVGAQEGLGPVLDIGRDPRWGRIEETFGEDPTLVTLFGVAYIKGLQGENLRDGGVMATGKHFIGHSLSQAGLNCAPVHLGPQEIWDVYLGPFQAAIRDAGLHAIMNSYPELDGEVVAASREILTDLLRDKLGFKGILVSDYEALMMLHTYHNIAQDLETAARLGLEAGIDIELPTRLCYGDPLKAALKSGKIGMDTVDGALRRLLIKKIELGLFDHPYVDEGRVSEIFDDPVNQFLAREIARQSLVLLKNDGLLPLKKDISSLAVIGPNADSSRCFHSGYSYVSMNELLNHNAIPGTEYEHPDPALWPDLVNRIPSLLASLKTAMPDLRLAYARGSEHKGQELDIAGAVTAAQQAGAVLLVLGDISGLTPPCTTGETRDVADLRLPGLQQELAEAVLAVGKPTVVILISGRPYLLNSLTEGANAILQAWIPGQEGAAAIVEALFGDTNPAGRLPLTFPRATGQVPIYYNQKPSGGKSNWYIDYVDTAISPLFPFGHGLSYTRFDYHDFSLSRKSATAGDTLEVRVTITNTGPVSGDEVVQLYIRDEFARYPRPVKELKGFARLSLEPWESKRVVFKLPVNLLAYYDRNQRLIVEPGTVQVMVGSSSEDIHYCDRFEIVGDVEVIQDRIFVCPVVVV